MLTSEYTRLQVVLQRVSAAADLKSEITLSAEDADLLIRWIMSEKYRHR